MLNRNYFGTQFGGSMFAMTDPFFALMMLRNLGPDYVVWDKAGAIEYRKPARGDVFARFSLLGGGDRACAGARRRAATSTSPTFRVDIVDAEDDVVAEVDEDALHPPPRAAR